MDKNLQGKTTKLFGSKGKKSKEPPMHANVANTPSFVKPISLVNRFFIGAEKLPPKKRFKYISELDLVEGPFADNVSHNNQFINLEDNVVKTPVGREVSDLLKQLPTIKKGYSNGQSSSKATIVSDQPCMDAYLLKKNENEILKAKTKETLVPKSTLKQHPRDINRNKLVIHDDGDKSHFVDNSKSTKSSLISNNTHLKSSKGKRVMVADDYVKKDDKRSFKLSDKRTEKYAPPRECKVKKRMSRDYNMPEIVLGLASISFGLHANKCDRRVSKVPKKLPKRPKRSEVVVQDDLSDTSTEGSSNERKGKNLQGTKAESSGSKAKKSIKDNTKMGNTSNVVQSKKKEKQGASLVDYFILNVPTRTRSMRRRRCNPVVTKWSWAKNDDDK